MQTLEDIKLAYEEALLNGKTREGYELIQEALNEGQSLIDIYLIIAEAMYSIGDLWETNDISIAQEHAATAITQFVLTQISAESIKHYSPLDTKAFIFSIESNTHYLGIQMIKSVFNVYGIQTFDYGPNVPNTDIVNEISEKQPHYVAYSVSMPDHIDKAKQLSQMIRECPTGTSPMIIIGGYAFVKEPHLLEQVDHDYYFPTILELEDWLREQTNMIPSNT
ncbi:Methanogenic corrinoid protein MtbC1 [Pelagirhabdus alkalitolerans]|uniref:Methanogenic corrinoid protein MtbC1 n=1 Tax=Pelagirhabdus alkalitolerans TaxID=1612202 RepID=A0A1G6MT64_9BACI|nr:B12-binding domain-containing protein [Pelagirhabdus alkalitolerans]SDC58176.1 Methanogenic corrinoid protein MtbC1 [Pelagirhabdus alkalitolerans]